MVERMNINNIHHDNDSQWTPNIGGILFDFKCYVN